MMHAAAAAALPAVLTPFPMALPSTHPHAQPARLAIPPNPLYAGTSVGPSSTAAAQPAAAQPSPSPRGSPRSSHAHSAAASSWLAGAPARRLRIFHALSFPACRVFSTRGTPLAVSDFDLDAVVLAAGGGAEGLEGALAMVAELDAEGLKLETVDQLNLTIAQRFQTRQTIALLTAAAQPPAFGTPAHPLVHMLSVLPNPSAPSTEDIAGLVARMLQEGMCGVDPALPLSDVLKALAKQPASSYLTPPTPTNLIACIHAQAGQMRRRVLARHLLSSASGAMLLSPLPSAFSVAQLAGILRATRDSLFWTFRHLHHAQAEQTKDESATAGSSGNFVAASRYTKDVPGLIKRIEEMHEQATGLAPLPPLPALLASGNDSPRVGAYANSAAVAITPSPTPSPKASPSVSVVNSTRNTSAATTPMIPPTPIPSAVPVASPTAATRIQPSTAFAVPPSTPSRTQPSAAQTPFATPTAANVNASPSPAPSPTQFHPISVFAAPPPLMTTAAFLPSSSGGPIPIPLANFFLPDDSPLVPNLLSPSRSAAALELSKVGPPPDASMSSPKTLAAEATARALAIQQTMNGTTQLPEIPGAAPRDGGLSLQMDKQQQQQHQPSSMYAAPAPHSVTQSPPPSMHSPSHVPLPHAQQSSPIPPLPFLPVIPPPVSVPAPTPPSAAKPKTISPRSAMRAVHMQYPVPQPVSQPVVPLPPPAVPYPQPQPQAYSQLHPQQSPSPPLPQYQTHAVVTAPPHVVQHQSPSFSPAPPVHPTPSPRSAASPSGAPSLSLVPVVSPPTRESRHRLDRAVVLAALSYPRCKLFASQPQGPLGHTPPIGPIQLTDHDLDELLRISGHVDACCTLLRNMEKEGIRVQSVDGLLTAFTAQAAHEKREELVQHLLYPRCTLFTQATRPIEIEDEDLDRVLAIAGALPLAIKAVAEFERSGRKFFSFTELTMALEADENVRRRKARYDAEQQALVHQQHYQQHAEQQQAAAAAAQQQQPPSPPPPAAADSQATLFPLLARALSGVDSLAAALHIGLRPSSQQPKPTTAAHVHSSPYSPPLNETPLDSARSSMTMSSSFAPSELSPDMFSRTDVSRPNATATIAGVYQQPLYVQARR